MPRFTKTKLIWDVIRGYMKSGFKDPVAIKKQDPKDNPMDGKKRKLSAGLFGSIEADHSTS